MVTYPKPLAPPMNLVPIADGHDPRLVPYRQLSDAVLLRQHGLFVAEGRLIVERLLAETGYQVESLLVNPASLVALGHVLEARALEAPVFLCSNDAFAGMTGFNLHRGCLALVRRPPLATWREAVAGARLAVVMEGVTNADNVGGVFRNAAAFGAGAVLLSPTCCDPLYRKAVRTSMGTVLRVPFARLAPWPFACADLRSEGFTIVALTPREPSMTVETFAASHAAGRVALLVGTEGPGLTDAAEESADLRVRIPTAAAVESLNLAVATGIALSRLARLR